MTVTPAIGVSIAITPSPATVVFGVVGSTTQLNAFETYSDGTVHTATNVANWTSDSLSIATVGPTTGLVTSVALGSAHISAAIGSVTGTVPLSVVTNAWFVTGSMSTIRINHTATLLPNGTVLVAGGASGASALFTPYLSGTNSAEIYNPASGMWTLTGNLSSGRTDHTATLLPNGNVLVTGGVNGNATRVLSSSEILDSSTGIWLGTGSLTSTRLGHTATLLPDGTVLVAGGYGTAVSAIGGIPSAETSAEIFNPATGSWTPTGSMSTARFHHTATLLSNGTVLVAGGDGLLGNPFIDGVDSYPVASAEIFNPATGSWTPTGSMSAERDHHTATLLQNGTVMVTGCGGAFWSSSEIYDPLTGTWSISGSLNTGRLAHTATLRPNGTVLVAGGIISGTIPTVSSEIYDPVAGVWSVTGSFNSARAFQTATLLPNGTVLAAGGIVLPNSPGPCNEFFCVPPTNLESAELYDPSH
jgi:hypothetical protein